MRKFTISLVLATTILNYYFKASHVTDVPEMLALSVCVGVSSALLALMWMEVFSTFNFRNAAILYSAMSLLGMMFNSLVGLISSDFESFLLLLISGVFAAWSVGKINSPDEPATESFMDEQSTKWTFPIKPVLLMGFYSLAMSFQRGATGPSQEVFLPNIGEIGISAVILALAIFAFDKFRPKVFFTLALPCMCASMLCIMISSPDLNQFASLFGGIGFFSFSIFTNLLLFNISFKFGISPLWLFGFSRASRIIANMASGFVSAELLVQPQWTNLVAGILIIVLTASSMIFFSQDDYEKTWGMQPVGKDSLNRITFEDRIARIARLHGLTHREEEVLALLAQGKNVPQIEELLFISKGTARNHVQHLYKKLDVHDRKELTDYFNSDIKGVDS